MPFKFNFSAEEEDTRDSQTVAQNRGINDIGNGTEVERKQAIEILSEKSQNKIDGACIECVACGDGTVIRYYLQPDQTTCSPDRTDSLYDLIPAVYEGGFKVWECSPDLTKYLSSLDIAFRGMTFLEVGCGAGIPGLYAMSRGATVHFQDYNEDVIQNCTIPNVYLNQTHTEAVHRFFSGDWSSLTKLLVSSNLRYDVILTSETIYNTDNYPHLLALFDATLEEHGVIYVAAKVHYFGVGGGTGLFQDYVQNNSAFQVTTVHSTQGGLQREILQLKRKPTT